jgi:hypothetical protein
MVPGSLRVRNAVANRSKLMPFGWRTLANWALRLARFGRGNRRRKRFDANSLRGVGPPRAEPRATQAWQPVSGGARSRAAKLGTRPPVLLSASRSHRTSSPESRRTPVRLPAHSQKSRASASTRPRGGSRMPGRFGTSRPPPHERGPGGRREHDGATAHEQLNDS